MWPDENRPSWWQQGMMWDTPEYWAKREAREKLLAARKLAQKDRPRRAKRSKIAKQSRRRNRA